MNTERYAAAGTEKDASDGAAARLFRKLIQALSFAVIVCATNPARAEAVYSVGVVPQFEARALASIWVPILAELSKRTGLQLSMKGAPRIPEFEVAFEVVSSISRT